MTTESFLQIALSDPGFWVVLGATGGGILLPLLGLPLIGILGSGACLVGLPPILAIGSIGPTLVCGCLAALGLAVVFH